MKTDNINNNKWLSKTENFTQGKISPQVPKRTKIFVMGNNSVILPDNAIISVAKSDRLLPWNGEKLVFFDAQKYKYVN